jgi:hypothetical protein
MRMSFIEWSQLLHGIGFVAHVLQDWLSSDLFRSASPNIRKFKLLIVASIMENANALCFLCEPSTRTPNKNCDLTFSLSI